MTPRAYSTADTRWQLRPLFPDALPSLEIEDWPDFPARGVMLDISRDKVPPIETLFSLIDLLAQWKTNQLPTLHRAHLRLSRT